VKVSSAETLQTLDMSQGKANKKDEFIATIDAHKRMIYKIVNTYCQNREDRKDVEQEIIIQLWNAFDTYNHEYTFSTWMYRIALNVAISFYRKEKKWAFRRDDYSEDSIPSIVDEEEDVAEMDRNIALLRKFIDDLNELNKALMLLYLEERPYAEIADILGITETNVGTKINRLKRILQQEFQKEQL